MSALNVESSSTVSASKVVAPSTSKAPCKSAAPARVKPLAAVRSPATFIVPLVVIFWSDNKLKISDASEMIDEDKDYNSMLISSKIII